MATLSDFPFPVSGVLSSHHESRRDLYRKQSCGYREERAMTRMRPYLAEFLGTFTLTFVVSVSLLHPLAIPTAVLAALTVGIFVYTIGPVSGAHLNPAVTIGLWSVKRISGKKAVGYVVAEVVGALFAREFLRWFFSAPPALSAVHTIGVGFAEAFGAFLLVFGISAVVAGAVPKGAAGVTIGGSLLLGILLASPWSNGILNPAVALGIGSVSFLYIVGPLVGGIAGARVHEWLNHPFP